jgi:hypothetical protein
MRLAPVVAVMAALAFAGVAQAAPANYYFDCTSTSHIESVDGELTPTWSSAAPADSVQDGAGCITVDPGPLTTTAPPNGFYDAVFGGTHTGAVRKMEVTLYTYDHPLFATRPIDVIVFADGEEVANITALAGTRSAGPVDKIGAYTYSITGLDIPSRRDQEILLAVRTAYADTLTGGWLQGASDIPSGARLFSFADLSPEEQAEILCAENEEFCTE